MRRFVEKCSEKEIKNYNFKWLIFLSQIKINFWTVKGFYGVGSAEFLTGDLARGGMFGPQSHLQLYSPGKTITQFQLKNRRSFHLHCYDFFSLTFLVKKKTAQKNLLTYVGWRGGGSIKKNCFGWAHRGNLKLKITQFQPKNRGSFNLHCYDFFT